MQHPCPVDQLPAAAQKALSGAAGLRMMLARGMAPLPPVALVSALYALAWDPDEALAAAAKQSLEKLPPAVLDGSLASGEVPAAVLDDLADRYFTRAGVAARIVQHASVAPSTIERIAQRADEALCELIATNDQRLIEHPAIIEALYLNRALRMSTADRIVELAARNGITLTLPGFAAVVAELQNTLIFEAGEESPTDQLFRDAMAEAEAREAGITDVILRDEDGEETLHPELESVEKSLTQMSMSEKIRTALIGSNSQRMLLARSANRAVAMAAVTSPRAQEHEAVQLSASRQVGEEVLRYISQRRDWVRLHQVKLNLCQNPKTPVPVSLRLLPHLRESDLKSLARSRNVSQSVKASVQQLLDKRGGK